MESESMKAIFFAFFAREFKGFSINASKSSPIQKTISASSIIFAWDGLKTNVWGLFVPSIINWGSPLVSIILDINECKGFIVVTTLMSVFTSAWELKLKNKKESPKNIDLLNKFILITTSNVILLHT